MVNSYGLTGQIIPIELVGMNASLSKDQYNDTYLTMINNEYPINDILGRRMKKAAERDESTLNGLISGSPLANIDGLNILRGILINSAQAGMWQPEIIEKIILKHFGHTVEDCLLDIKKDATPTDETNTSNYNAGARLTRSRGLMLPTSYMDNLILLPSQEAIELFAGNAGRKPNHRAVG